MSNPKISLTQLPYQAVIQTPFGALGICMQDQRLKSLDFLPQEAVAKGDTRCGPWRGRHFRRLQAVENEGNEKSHFSFPCCKGPMEGLLQYPPQERGTLEPLDMATALVAESLLDYLNDPKSTIPFEPLLEGTEFQQRVWHRLLQIPPGTTVTYGQLAQELHSSPRAIGNACRANPLSAGGTLSSGAGEDTGWAVSPVRPRDRNCN